MSNLSKTTAFRESAAAAESYPALSFLNFRVAKIFDSIKVALSRLAVCEFTETRSDPNLTST